MTLILFLLDWLFIIPSSSNSQCINTLRIVLVVRIMRISITAWFARWDFFVAAGIVFLIVRVISANFCNNLCRNKSCCTFEIWMSSWHNTLHKCRRWSRGSVVAPVLLGARRIHLNIVDSSGEAISWPSISRKEWSWENRVLGRRRYLGNDEMLFKEDVMLTYLVVCLRKSSDKTRVMILVQIEIWPLHYAKRFVSKSLMV